jgi:hypothetical protein
MADDKFLCIGRLNLSRELKKIYLNLLIFKTGLNLKKHWFLSSWINSKMHLYIDVDVFNGEWSWWRSELWLKAVKFSGAVKPLDSIKTVSRFEIVAAM